MIPQNMGLWEFIKILYIAYENAHYSTLHNTLSLLIHGREVVVFWKLSGVGFFPVTWLLWKLNNKIKK